MTRLFLHFWNVSATFKISQKEPVSQMCAGTDPGGGGDRLHKTYKSNFSHHDFYNSENNIRDINPFCRPLFCNSSVVKYTSLVLQ